MWGESSNKVEEPGRPRHSACGHQELTKLGWEESQGRRTRDDQQSSSEWEEVDQDVGVADGPSARAVHGSGLADGLPHLRWVLVGSVVSDLVHFLPLLESLPLAAWLPHSLSLWRHSSGFCPPNMMRGGGCSLTHFYIPLSGPRLLIIRPQPLAK